MYDPPAYVWAITIAGPDPHRRAVARARRSVRVASPRPHRGDDRQARRGHRPRSGAAALLQGNLAGPAPRVPGRAEIIAGFRWLEACERVLTKRRTGR